MRRRETLSGKLIRTLSERIAIGQYPAGERLPSEQEMIDEFGVSRTVVREAIANLKAGGLVKTVQGLGAFVLQTARQSAFQIEENNHLDEAQEMIQILELRLALEEEAAALAAQRRTQEQLDIMQETLIELRNLLSEADEQSGARAADADIRFHRAIAQATGNMHFLRLFNYLAEYMASRSRLPAFKFGGGALTDYLHRTLSEHGRIHAAIAAGDADTARAAMRLHLAGSRDRLRQRLNDITSS